MRLGRIFAESAIHRICACNAKLETLYPSRILPVYAILCKMSTFSGGQTANLTKKVTGRQGQRPAAHVFSLSSILHHEDFLNEERRTYLSLSRNSAACKENAAFSAFAKKIPRVFCVSLVLRGEHKRMLACPACVLGQPGAYDIPPVGAGILTGGECQQLVAIRRGDAAVHIAAAFGLGHKLVERGLIHI